MLVADCSLLGCLSVLPLWDETVGAGCCSLQGVGAPALAEGRSFQGSRLHECGLLLPVGVLCIK